MLTRASIPGLFITGTDTGVGKTLVAGAIADWFRRRGRRVAVCKPVATGCQRRREGLVSEDAEFLAHHADAKFPLNTICPQRFAEALAPAIAAERAKQKIEWEAIDGAIQSMAGSSDCLIVEGVGGIMVPMDRRHTVLDMIGWLGLPVVIVARAGLGTINHTLLTLEALRNAKAAVAGVVINQYPAETPSVVEETNPRAIEKWGDVPILCLVPRFVGPAIPELPRDVVAAVEPVDWLAKARAEIEDMPLSDLTVVIIIQSLWLMWAIYWLVNAFGNKPNIYKQSHFSRLVGRLVFVAAIVCLVNLSIQPRRFFPETLWTQLGGIALCAMGLGMAIWARRVLGGNWSGRITLKENHELIRRGPYRFVRHPIYSALILAVLGTVIALVPSIRGLGILAVVAAGVTLKARGEERLLTRRFPEGYPQYKREVKALIPFIV